jgi:hypothetical protein
MHPSKEARNLWGVEVLVTTEQAAGTGLLIDTKKFGYIVVREGLSLRTGGSSARSAPLPRSRGRRRSWPLQREREMPPQRAAGRRPVFIAGPGVGHHTSHPCHLCGNCLTGGRHCVATFTRCIDAEGQAHPELARRAPEGCSAGIAHRTLL